MRAPFSKGLFLLLLASVGCLQSSCLKSTDPGLPRQVVDAIQETGVNRIELTKTVAKYIESDDTSRLHAAYYLIANIPHHYAVDYDIQDTTGVLYEFDPLAFNSFEEVEAYWKARGQAKGGLHYVPKKYTLDRDTISANFLIQNIEDAFRSKTFAWTKNYSPQSFKAYVLPYRFGNEHLTNWRSDILRDYQWLINRFAHQQSPDTLIQFVDALINKEYQFDERFLRLPNPQSYSEISKTKKGNYQDLSYLKASLLRSFGIPSTIDYVPFLADTVQAFYFAVAQNEQGEFMPLLPPNTAYLFEKKHIPKVFRRGFEPVNSSLFAIKKISLKTPPFIGHFHYMDVTSTYFSTSSIAFRSSNNDTLFYIAVMNDKKWKATDWKITLEQQVLFQQMVEGPSYAMGIMKNDSLQIISTQFTVHTDTLPMPLKNSQKP